MMVQQQTVDTGDTPEVVISQADGDMRLMGWDRKEVLAKSDGELELSQHGDTVTVKCQGDAVVRVPEGARLRLDNASGDVRVKSVNGEVTIGNVSGDLAVRHTGAVRIESSSGDVSVKHANGAVAINHAGGDVSVLDVQGLNLDTVGGDLDARAVRGPVQIDSVNGDLVIEGAQGNITVETVGGDARVIGVQGSLSVNTINGDADVSGVQGSVTVTHVHGDLNAQGPSNVNASVDGDATIALVTELGASSVTARGDISCRFTPESNATVDIHSDASSISLDVPGAERSIEEANYVLTLGAGGVTVKLDAGGDVSVTSRSPAAQPRKHKGGPEFDFDFNFDFDSKAQEMAGRWADIGGLIGRRAAEAAERVAARAQAKVQQAQQRAEEHARRAERHAAFVDRRMGGSWRHERPSAPPPPPPPSAPVSDEERLTILRMLEQKKITAAQAEQLLAALSGK